jgi:hypothetical protein
VKHEKTKFSRSRSGLPVNAQRPTVLIRKWKPWESSTGPVTDEGKVISSQNPFKTGCHSAEIKQNQAYLRQLIKNFSEFF